MRSTSYDPVLVGDDGAALLRPGKPGRLGEPDAIAAVLETAGVPVASRMEAPATAEGGDTVWLDHDTLLVGSRLSHRRAGIDALRTAFPDATVIVSTSRTGTASGEVMHLMTFVSPLDRDLALVYPRLAPVRLLRAARGARDRGRRGSRRRVRDMGPNVLALGPASRARPRGERRDEAPSRAGGGRCRHLSRRRDLAQG